MNYSYNEKTAREKNNKLLTLEDAYSYCKNISRHHAKTFYLASLFLPKKQQNPIFAIYALLRTVDDVVDMAEDKLKDGLITSDEISMMLESWKSRLKACYAGNVDNDPVWR